MGSIEKDSTVVIFCSEDHHTMLGDTRDRFNSWVDTTWTGKDNNDNEAWVRIGIELGADDVKKPLPDPRKTICASAEALDAYTSIGTLTSPSLRPMLMI